MLEVKNQTKIHDPNDTKTPWQEAVNDDSDVLTGRQILVLIFVFVGLGIFQQSIID